MSKHNTVHSPGKGNEAPAINEGELPVVLKLSIPQDLYAEYEKLAELQGLTVTELVMHRLRRCKDHNGLRTLYFSDSQRAQLENALQKKPLETADQALGLINTALTVKVSTLPVQLTAQQLKRISMGGYAGMTAEQRFAEVIKGAISKAYGI